MGKYASAAATAKGLIAKKGGPVTLVRRTGSAFDPVTQQETATEQSWTLTAVALPTSKRSQEYQPGSLTKDLNVKFLFALAGSPVEPAIGDQVVYGGRRWTIFDLKTVDPAGDGGVYTEARAEA